MGKQATSVNSQVLARIRQHGGGTVFTPADFVELGPRNAVDLALSRSARADTIRKLARGVYDMPRRDARLGDLSPSPDGVASALAGRDSARLQASEAHVPNLLGLSDQVPVRLTFLTDGRSRRVQLGQQQILKHTTPRQMATAGRISGTVIQALRWLGRDHIDDQVVSHSVAGCPTRQAPTSAGPPLRAHVGRRSDAQSREPSAEVMDASTNVYPRNIRANSCSTDPAFDVALSRSADDCTKTVALLGPM